MYKEKDHFHTFTCKRGVEKFLTIARHTHTVTAGNYIRNIDVSYVHALKRLKLNLI